MKKFVTLFGLFFFCFCISSVSAKNITDYPFVKSILLPDTNQEVEVPFDLDVLHSVNQSVRNVSLFDTENNKVPFDLFIQEPGRIRDLEVISVSSSKTDESETSAIIDNNILTSFEFDLEYGRKDQPAEIIIDLKEPRLITRFEIFDSAGPRIDELLLRGGMNQRNMKTILSQRPYAFQYDIQSHLVQYLHIYLWGKGVVVDDVRVYAFLDASAYFTPDSDTQYVLAYGDKNLNTVTYGQRLTEKKPNVPLVARLANQEWNSLYPDDVDNDGIVNDFDNCFLVANVDQKDTDEDGVGDACDNAPFIKNIGQDDVDFDGIGDVKDNCPLQFNKAQEDVDNDGIGDVCDESFTEQDVSVSPISYTIIILVVLVLVLLTQVNRIRKIGASKEE